MKRHEILGHVWRRFEPEISQLDYELVEVEFSQQGRMFILRLFIDKEDGGVTLNDCVAVSQLLSPILDAEDVFIDGEYVLEVSSPGIERPLRKPKDFERYTGAAVRIVTHEAAQGRKRFSGVLKSFSDGLIVLECDGVPVEVHIENLKKANLNR